MPTASSIPTREQEGRAPWSTLTTPNCAFATLAHPKIEYSPPEEALALPSIHPRHAQALVSYRKAQLRRNYQALHRSHAQAGKFPSESSSDKKYDQVPSTQRRQSSLADFKSRSAQYSKGEYL
eukprot:CAMPEP_0196171698 /NCGR_PEP_ID=MMETSP0911-20130528/5624_1 /TAXON_ID=49265 /ORGANISM="Thalassiosira rotula, Strain GSO102" /LENGTH=122 /DNA_ID=CAMNT_0041438565 /DNA_START=236 /DNA_END=601 /DNA_ORIENTATION=+